MGRHKKKTIILISAAVILLLSLFLTYSPMISGTLPAWEDVFAIFNIGSNHLDRIVFINVGQGDSALIISQESTALIDCGIGSDGGGSILRAMRQNGVERIDHIIITHPHDDHIGGVTAIVGDCSVGEVLMPEFYPQEESDRAAIDNMLAALSDEKVVLNPLKEGARITVGNFDLSVLYLNTTADGENDRSAVIKAVGTNFSALFTGDIEKESEYAMMEQKLPLAADVLKISHHGSDTSSNKRFVRSVAPKIAVISVGENTFGHPSDRVLDDLQELNIKCHRTDIHGNITVYFDEELIIEDEF